MSAETSKREHARSGPHQHIPTDHERDRFAAELFDALWERYRQRVAHVGTYEQVIADAGATFVNDHIAFRTFAGQRPLTGISSISRIFEALGYEAAGCYQFPDKHLGAIHFQHPNPQFPKLFISELKLWELSPSVQSLIGSTLSSLREPIGLDSLTALCHADQLDNHRRADLLNDVLREFHELPWSLPEKERVIELNDESQYAAWVLVHGFQVNHFTSLINSHGVESLDDIEKTVRALQSAGVPMKADIEGEPGSKLRQTATEAVVIDVDVLDQGKPAKMPWTYAYFELAERGEIVDPESGRSARFEGFLGPQATQLFEMTRLKS